MGLVKFHMRNGETAQIACVDKKGRDSGDVGHAVSRFKQFYGDIPFELDGDYKARKTRELDGLINIAARAEAEYQEFLS